MLPKTDAPIGKILPFQLPIRPALPTVYGNVDYTQFSNRLHRIDELLHLSGVEKLFVEISLRQFYERVREVKISMRSHLNYQKHCFRALRCMILMSLLGGSYRKMSRRLAECALFQWFCRIDEIDGVRVPSKSTLQEYANWLPAEMMRLLIDTLLKASMDSEQARGLNLANALELETVWMDATCIKANIHFPVDWVLLRDAVRTLMKATMLIRRHGLRERMEDPQIFLTQMNRLSIGMTHSNRWVKDSKKQRKKFLRLMKRQVKVVEAHARRHRELLDQQWQKTDWTRKQAEQVLRRIDSVLQLLPRAKKQAHERIIGERIVANEDKILSLYESEIHVMVRKKAGAEVEFGNHLLLTEQKEGMIVDWSLHRDGIPSDCKQLAPSIARIEEAFGRHLIQAACTDRGFESSENIELLSGKRIYNAICPKNPRSLRERMKEEKFARLQKRRGQTEARIGIFKNAFLGKPLRVRGFDHRDTAIAWNVLAHNLWVLARLEKTDEVQKKKAA